MRMSSTVNRSMLGLLASSLLLLPGCASDRAVISNANQAHADLEPAVIHDSELSAYLQTVGERIIASARTLTGEGFGPEAHRKEDSSWMFSSNIRFHFVNSSTVNAFTTGGEHMYIYNELFQKCRTEDELAAVMAHEYAHIYSRHVHKGMNRQYTVLGIAAAAGIAGAAAGGSEHGVEYGLAAGGGALAAGQFISMGYSREDENEADELGFAFYTHAGWDPKHFADFFQQMIEMGHDTTPEFVSSHPSLASRVDASKARVAALPPEAAQWRRPPVADASRFKQLQARAAEVGKALPNDQTLLAQKVLAAYSNCFAPGPNPDQEEARRELSGGK